VQVNLLVGRQVASFTEGAVAWLSYADRLYQLPLGVVGIAIGTVLLPDLSRRLRAGDGEGGRNAFNRATEICLALTVPAAVALMVIPIPLVMVLFERGAFGRSDTVATALVLAIYGAGLPAFVLHKVLQPLYYAREDTRRPFRYALVSLVVNAAVAVGLMPYIGFAAAALGTTVDRLWRILLAAAVMGAVLWGLAMVLDTALSTPRLRYLALAGLVAAGIASYFAAAFALGALRPADLRRALRR
jgi:putative peptidoglycan lipid II flippase